MGGVFLIIIVLAFTSVPYYARMYLAKVNVEYTESVETIVIMGGGGFPSEALMMRLWYTMEASTEFPNSKIVLTTPGKLSDSLSTIFQMQQYLIDQGIDAERIVIENVGVNTRHQAQEVYRLYQKEEIQVPLLIVSSPAHIKRSVLSFKKVGFNKVYGKPAMEQVLEVDLRLKNRNLGGNKIAPNAGNSIAIRYQFWDYMKYEIEVLREYLALFYYSLHGWI